MSKPTLRIVPSDGVRSDAQLACDIAADYGYPADPWQFDLIDDILRERANGLYAAPVFGYSLPRRNGKSHIVVILTLYFMLVQNAEVIYTAQHSVSSNAFFQEMLRLFDEGEALSEYVKPGGVVRREGREGIYLSDGGSFRVLSRAEGKDPGRGLKCDVLFFDEALDITESSHTSLPPMNLNSTNPLTIYLGSPSYADKPNGFEFRRIRANAMRGDNPRLGWVEWSAPEGADMYSPEVWRACNPAMSSPTPRITEETLESKAHSTERKKFMVEYLGSWAGETRMTVIDMDDWKAMSDHTAALTPEIPKVWAVDAASDGSVATIVAAATLESGNRYVEKVQRLSGVSWVSQKVIGNCKAFPSIQRVLIDSKGPLAHLADEWRAAGVPVVLIDWDYLANAAGSFVLSSKEHSFKHQGDGELERSVRSATAKPLSDRYKFVPYDRTDPDSDITGIVAMSLALYALKSDKAFKKIKKKLNTDTFSIGGKVYHRR